MWSVRSRSETRWTEMDESARMIAPSFDYSPPAEPLRVLYKSSTVLIVDKPAGLLSVPGKASHLWDCVASRVAETFPGARIVHRLDMATSGVMALARTADALRNLGLQFERRHVRKRYRAIVSGRLVGAAGVVGGAIAPDWPRRPLQRIDPENGRAARTEWRRITTRGARGDETTLVDLFPHTGRSHQLRVHMTTLGHPILGDAFYARRAVAMAAPRLLLHAAELRFRDPFDGSYRVVASEPPFV